MKRRILSGGVYQESHSFNPITTDRSRFEFCSGAEAAESFAGTNTTLGGILDAAARDGVEVVLPSVCNAQPGGPVDHAIHAECRDALVAAARAGGFDAIVLPLHGAMLTTELDDPEGDLFAALRAAVGPEVPITAGFDLHALVSPDTLAPVDFVTGFRTNPHGDMGETGARAYRGATDMLDGSFAPVCASVHFPMLTLGNDTTDAGPVRDLFDEVRAAVGRGEVYDASVFTIQQFLDVPRMGQTVLAYGNGEGSRAAALAEALARRLWDARGELVGSYPSLAECLAEAARPGRTRPMVLGDQGDRVAGGGPGDSTYALAVLKAEAPDLPAVLGLRDAAAVDACMAAGVGAELSLSLGGRYSTATPPVPVTGRVVAAAAEAELVMRGPLGAGRRTRMGRHAVLASGAATIVVTDDSHSFIDPMYYACLGIDLAAAKVVVVRSGYHFHLNYASTGDCVTVDTPGITAYRPAELPFRRARPFYPLDPVPYAPVRTATSRAARIAAGRGGAESAAPGAGPARGGGPC